jgi:hypothetical protein
MPFLLGTSLSVDEADLVTSVFTAISYLTGGRGWGGWGWGWG